MKRTVIRCKILFCVFMAIIGCGDGEGLDGHKNSPPVIDHLVFPDMVNPGDSVELQVVTRDVDGDVLHYVWEAEKGKFDSRTESTVTWTAPSDAKWAIVKVSVNDGINKPTIKSRKIEINLKNAAPVIEEIVVPESVHAGSSVQLQAKTDDADGDALTYNWEVEAGTLSSETASAPTWTAPIDMGIMTVTLKISDGINAPVTESITVRVIHSLIVPGEQAAGIKLGDHFDKVKALYGEPEERNRIGHFFYFKIGFSGLVDGINHVESLSIREPNKAKTAGGVGVGSALERVEEEFGPAEEIKDGGESHWYWKKGIQFSYDVRSRIESVYIFKPHNFAAPAKFDDAARRNRALIHKAALKRFLANP